MKTRVYLYNGNVWVNWLDENGEPVPESVMGRGVFGDDDQTTYSCTYRAFDTLPGEMKLEFYRPGAGTIAQVTVPLRELRKTCNKEVPPNEIPNDPETIHAA